MSENRGKHAAVSTKRKRHAAVWLTAAVLILALTAIGAFLWYSVQIHYNSDIFEGSELEYVSGIVESNTEYLSQTVYQRMISVISGGIAKPDNFRQYDIRSSMSIAYNDFDTAASYYEGCLETYTGTSDKELSLINLKEGCLWLMAGRSENAQKYLDAAIELDPESADAYLIRGQLRYASGNSEGALEDIERYEALSDASAVISNSMAGLYESCGLYDKAIKCYDMMIESGDYDISVLGSRGRCNIISGNTEKGRQDLDRYFAEGGTDDSGEISVLLGVCLMNEGAYEDALNRFKAVENSGYENIKEIVKYEAVCEYRLGDYASAAQHFEEILNNGDESAENNYYAGLSYMKVRDYRTAESYMVKAAQSGKYAASANYNAALCCVQRDAFEDAVVYLNKSLENKGDEETVLKTQALLDEIQEFFAITEYQAG